MSSSLEGFFVCSQVVSTLSASSTQTNSPAWAGVYRPRGNFFENVPGAVRGILRKPSCVSRDHTEPVRPHVSGCLGTVYNIYHGTGHWDVTSTTRINTPTANLNAISRYQVALSSAIHVAR